MRYEDAAKIGTNVEGYVRCTYAKLHDIQNGFLFALQHHDAWKLTDAHLQASDYFGGEHAGGGGALRPSIQDEIERSADHSGFVEDVPVVKAIRPVTAWGGKKFVEVQLTDYCRDLLWRKAKSMRKNESMEELLNPDATFLVKDVAIDWFPTNMKGAFIEDPKTGKLVTIEVALDDARKRLDRAKAILAAATTFAII